jgi:protein ImuB
VISVVPSGPPAQFHFAGVDYRIARAWGPERIETGWWRKLGAGDAVMARSPDRVMNPTAGLPERRRPSVSRVAWSGDHATTSGAGIRRDYYRVETTGGRHFWLFRRLSDGRWFLHGEFG